MGGVVEVQLHAFLTLELDGGEWSALRLDSFTPWEKAGAGWALEPVWTWWR
jgi:hypothetical protein